MDFNQMEKETRPNGKSGPGTLYLCATPIGNLEDITLRVLRILKEVDLIAAEDTRDSKKLLSHFSIDTPMTSYHAYNRIEKADWLAGELAAGKNIALITDAGTPGISDPGEDLVRICAERGIPVTSLPGAAACITALTVSGLPTRRFAFEAFLPEDKKERRRILSELERETRTMIIYTAPHDVRKLLPELQETLGDRRIAVCRELTKRYETILRTTIGGASAWFENETPRGEFVLVIEGQNPEAFRQAEQAVWAQMTIAEHMARYETQGISRKDAMKQVAKDRGIGKREVYKELLEQEADQEQMSTAEEEDGVIKTENRTE